MLSEFHRLKHINLVVSMFEAEPCDRLGSFLSLLPGITRMFLANSVEHTMRQR